MTRVYDSGSDIEDTHARLRPEIFNAEININHIIHQTADHRSDNKAHVTKIYHYIVPLYFASCSNEYIILHILPNISI